MENIEKVDVLVIGYDAIKDTRQFKIAVLKSVNLNFVKKIYYLEKGAFTDQIKDFCKDFGIECEGLIPLPAKPSNEQLEKLSEIKSLVLFNNGDDKRIKKYEAFAKKLPIYVNIWRVKNGDLVLK